MSYKFSITRFSVSHKFTFLFLSFLVSCFLLQAQQPVAPVAGKSSFTARLINIEAATNEVFRYTITLHNGSGSARVYELQTKLPLGWTIVYRIEGTQVTSINMDAGKTQDITVEINATLNAVPNKYNVPIKAVSNSDTLLLNLEAVVKGFYSMALSTPTGRLSDEVTSGGHKELKLTVKNLGSLPLNDLDISSQLPSGWEATFDPVKIKQLEPGKTADVAVSLKVPDKTIAGDYAATFVAKNANLSEQIAFRFIVTTSLLSGWIGILVILLAIGIVYYLIRKYGRR